jgi:hypothetical protein
MKQLGAVVAHGAHNPKVDCSIQSVANFMINFNMYFIFITKFLTCILFLESNKIFHQSH